MKIDIFYKKYEELFVWEEKIKYDFDSSFYYKFLGITLRFYWFLYGLRKINGNRLGKLDIFGVCFFFK